LIRLLKFFGYSIVAIVCGLLLVLSGAYLYLSPGLPSVEALRSIQLQIPLRVYSSDEKLIAEFGEMRRTPIRFADIPPNFINALLSAEDDNFANHYGVDPSSLVRAATQLVKSGHIQSGGSTITMQVAKNFFLTSERSFSRKATEILLALQIERQLTKDEILELYVNKIYLGNRAYGIEAASQVYYGKSIRDASLAQMAMIAGLPKAPSRFNPLANPARSKERRDWILGRMYKLGKISQSAYESAVAEPLNASYHVPTPEVNAPYIAEMARAEMVGRYGSEAYTEGFRVTTTVPSDLQEIANNAVHEGLITYDQRHGYRGPESRLPGKTLSAWTTELGKQRTISGLEPAIVTQVKKDGVQVLTRTGEAHVAWDSMKWARPFLNTNSMGPMPKQPSDVAQVGDLIRVQRQKDDSLKFSQVPVAQGALVSLDPQNGAIRALVGGFAFEQSNYNRATQAKAPAGFELQAVRLQCRPGQRLHRRQPGQRCTDRVCRRVPGQGLASEERHQHLPRPDPHPRGAVQVAQPGVDPLAAGDGRGQDHRLHHPLWFQQGGPAAEPVPGPGDGDPHADGNRHRLEHVCQRRLQDHAVPDRQDRKPQWRHPVHRQPATGAG